MEVLSVLFWYALAANASILEALFVVNKSARKYYSGLLLPQISPSLAFATLVWSTLWLLQATATFLYLRHLERQWTVDVTLLIVSLPFAIFALPSFVRLKIVLLALTMSVVALGLDIAVCIRYFKVNLVSGWLILPTVVWLGYLCIWMAYICITQAPRKSTPKTLPVTKKHRPPLQLGGIARFIVPEATA